LGGGVLKQIQAVMRVERNTRGTKKERTDRSALWFLTIARA